MTAPPCALGLRTGSSRSLVAILALAVGSCGGAEERDPASPDSGAPIEVRQTVQRFYDALAQRDGEAACHLLTLSFRRQLDTTAQRCPREVLHAAIGPEPPRNAGIGRSSARGRSATAVVTRAEGHGAAERVLRERVALERTRGEWRIADVEEAD